MVKASVARTPEHHGDGYGYGGDWLLTIGAVTLNLGVYGQRLANEIATRWNESARSWPVDHIERPTHQEGGGQ